MDLIPGTRKVQTRKYVAFAVLALTLMGALVFTIITLSVKKQPSETPPSNNENDNVSVFKPADENAKEDDKTTPPDTAEPIDTSGVNGMKYISKGNGTCAIIAIGTCQDTELKIPAYSPAGDIVVQISDSAFENCTQLLAVNIPATVKSIGAGVFRGCANLVAINVDTDNSVYCSVGGVLFSEDKKVLVAYPMNRPGNNYLLPIDTRAVAAYAFEGALNLQTILYQGGIKDFQKIEFLMGNGIIDELMITCNYTGSK